MNKNNLNRADNILNKTSPEKRIKFNLSQIEAVAGPTFEDPSPSMLESDPNRYGIPVVENKPAKAETEAPVQADAPFAVYNPPEEAEQPAPVKEEPIPVKEEPTPVKAEPAPVKAEPAPVKAEPAPVKAEPAPVKAEPAPVKAEPAPVKAEPTPVKAEPVPVKAEPAPVKAEPVPVKAEPAPIKVEPAPVKTEPAAKEEPVQTQQSICIIDETSTTVIIEHGPDITADEIAPVRAPAVSAPVAPAAPVAVAAAPTAEPKEKIKFKVGHIIVLALVGLIALWTLIYTVDHTFATQGLTPSIFCVEDKECDEPNMVRYKGLGYTIEYIVDENTGKVVSQKCETAIGALINTAKSFM